MSPSTEIKSFIPFYWRVWLVLIFLLLSVRFLIFQEYHEDDFFLLFTIYAVPTWVAVMILNFYEGHRLMKYLKMNHREKWEYITYVPLFGSGGVNAFRTLPFLFSKDDLSDNAVFELKNNYKRFIRLTLTIFFTFPVLFFIVMLRWRR